MEIKRSGSQPSGKGPAESHIAVLEHLEGKSVDGMEKVTDEEYADGENAE